MHKPSQAALALLLVVFAHFSWAAGLSCKDAYKSTDFLFSSQITIVEQLKKGMSSQAYVVQSAQGKSVFLRNLHIDANLKLLNSLREYERNFLVRISKLSLAELRNIVDHNNAHQEYDFKKFGLKVSDSAPTSFEGRRTESVREIASAIAELMINFDYLKKLTSFQEHGQKLAPEPQAIILDSKTELPIGLMGELLPGKDLAQLVESHQINRHQIEKVREQVLDQLAFLHRNGLLHGDINPGNIMVQFSASGEPVVRLIDFTPPEIAVFKSPVVEKAMFESFLINLLRKYPVKD